MTQPAVPGNWTELECWASARICCKRCVEAAMCEFWFYYQYESGTLDFNKFWNSWTSVTGRIIGVLWYNLYDTYPFGQVDLQIYADSTLQSL